jgi:hypothetical protein
VDKVHIFFVSVDELKPSLHHDERYAQPDEQLEYHSLHSVDVPSQVSSVLRSFAISEAKKLE